MDAEAATAIAALARIRLIRKIQKRFSEQLVDWAYAEEDSRSGGVRWAQDRLEEMLRHELDGTNEEVE